MNQIKDLYNDFINGLVYVNEEYPIITAIGFLILGGILMYYQLNKKGAMEKAWNGTLPAWSVFLNTWVIILMFLIWGIILLAKNLF